VVPIVGVKMLAAAMVVVALVTFGAIFAFIVVCDRV
jgi:hypothetical protein